MALNRYIRLQDLNKILAVSAIIFNSSLDKLLLVKENKYPHIGAWGPPGGKVEIRDSDYKQATYREVLEETGYHIKVGSPIEIVTLPQFLIISSLGQIYGDKITPVTGEIVQWWNLEEFQQTVDKQPDLFVSDLKAIVDRALLLRKIDS